MWYSYNDRNGNGRKKGNKKMSDKRISELVNLVTKLVAKGYGADAAIRRIQETLQISDEQTARVQNWYNAGLVTT
jgi:hypothetical protein